MVQIFEEKRDVLNTVHQCEQILKVEDNGLIERETDSSAISTVNSWMLWDVDELKKYLKK